MTPPTSTRRTPRVAIIGSGFAGLCLGIRSKKAGFDEFTIFEKADRLGGVWRDNTYPGAACDVPSYVYSYSFAPNDWSRPFAQQPEILAYQQRCAAEYGLTPHIRFNTEIVAAQFDDETQIWQLRTADGDAVEADVLVPACGQLSVPAYPNISGLEQFDGTVFHSARWDHDHDLTGRRVAVIGTGASAIQFVPRIVDQTSHLTIFQRTPTHIIPKPDFAHPSWQRTLFQRLPLAQKASRLATWALFEAAVSPGIVYDRINRVTTAPFWLAYYTQLRRHVRDPKLRQALTADYHFGCKRPLFSNDWYPTLARTDVDVVTERIREIGPTAVITDDGVKHEVDTIILGTGFKAHNFMAPMEIRGTGGVELAQAWHSRAEAYLGMTVSGFANMF